MRLLVLVCSLLFAIAVTAGSRIASLTHVRRVNSHDAVALLVAVHQNHLEELASACESVSSPTHEQYGQYWTRDEVAELVGNPHAVKRVVAWLRSLKALHIEVLPTNDFVRARLPAKAVEKALQIQLHLFRDPNSKSVTVRSNGKYTLPSALRGLVDHIVGVEPVDLANPTTLQPHGTHRSHAFQSSRPAPLSVAKGPTVSIGEVTFGDDGTSISLKFWQYCSNGDVAFEKWPCNSTANPIAWYAFTVYELQTKRNITINITEENAASYDFGFESFNEVYHFTVHNVAQLFGHYQLNLTSIGTQGDRALGRFPSGLGDDNKDFTLSYELGVPSVLHSLYGVPDTATKVANNSLAMAAFMGQTFSTKDLDQFLKEYNIPASAKDVTVIGFNDGSGGEESMLDLDMESSVAPNVPLYYIYIGADGSSQDFLLEWGASISAMVDAPLVHSISYGIPESMFETYFGIPIDQYAARTNAELQKICVRGLTVLVASGDAGSTDEGHGGSGCRLQPMYPASSPWVTTVGATALDTVAGRKPNGSPGEVAVAISNGQFWTTGGGFSAVASQTTPSWQADSVAQYLKAASYMPKNANFSLRAYPDIAALGDSIMMVDSGEDVDAGGTSASSPMTAAMIAHLNAARLAAGKAPIGFFNPLLYSIYAEHPEMFFDVTIGEISCGDGICCPFSLGYPATKGWDVASGVGSISDLQALTKLVLQY